ncbi:class I SAM-dependent methyltransferase [Corynebacterium vitaeruminis]|uniref:class I SAM-dependent methyltransferase n=1 Tax=Corynebacterium vitaeruminis TaxID=38305 RepID=UPI0023F18D29|nr:class I SAM-dependent methyltransferase [Corynebacterium vitaeruminis]
MTSLARTARFSTLRRSFSLLASFRHEQPHPEIFYSGLARDTRELIEHLLADASLGALQDKRVLDVGGGPGYFATEFSSRGAYLVSLEPDVGEMSAAGIALSTSIRGDGMNLPLCSDSFDVTYSSNVAEHVPDPWRMGEEMLRVTKPGGLAILSYTIWLGPFGGHETGLWQHYVSGGFARDRYQRKHGHPPKNVFGTSLFDVSCAEGIAWAQKVAARGDAEVVALIPRYHPWWAWWMVRVPVLREFLVSNLVIVLRKQG